MPPGQILTSQTVDWTRPQNSPTSCGKCHGLEGGKQRRKESRGKTGFGGEKKTFDEMFDLSTEQASKFVRELAFPEERHRTTWRNEKKKPTKKSLVTVPPFVCQMWKYLHITLRTESFKKKEKKKAFQPRSPQQSIFPWQTQSVETRSCGYEESNISISLFNSYWQPAYVDCGTGWSHY